MVGSEARPGLTEAVDLEAACLCLSFIKTMFSRILLGDIFRLGLYQEIFSLGNILHSDHDIDMFGGPMLE